MADRKFPLGALDVLEQGLVAFDPFLLDKLLKDKTTGTKNIGTVKNFAQINF